MFIEAPAKINLTLDILGRRPDGFHELRTVMQSVSLCDRLSVCVNGTGEIRVFCDRPEVPRGPENTVFRAAEAFFQETGLSGRGADIAIEKRVPSRAGLGGGSADAAAVLRALDRLCRTGLTLRELTEIGLSAGADVPFCTVGGTALAEGMGERLTPLPPLPSCGIVICKPADGLGTKEAYDALDASGALPSDDTGPMLEALEKRDLPSAAGLLGNGFEKASRTTETAEIEKAMLAAGSLGACRTGTGSAVFGLFPGREEAARCRDLLAAGYGEVFCCFPLRAEEFL